MQHAGGYRPRDGALPVEWIVALPSSGSSRTISPPTYPRRRSKLRAQRRRRLTNASISRKACAPLAMWMRVCRLFWPTIIRQRIKDERLPAFRSTGSCVPSPASGGGSPLSSQHRRCAARRNVPLRPSGFVEERLHCFEQHQAVLFHHDGVGALGQLDVALARRVDEEREQGLSHVGGSVAVPFRVHEQRRRRDLGGVVVGPPGGEEFIAVLLDAVGRADDRRIHLGP